MPTEQTTSNIEQKFCTNCGNKLESGGRFCTNCGTKAGEPESQNNNENSESLQQATEAGSEEEDSFLVDMAVNIEGLIKENKISPEDVQDLLMSYKDTEKTIADTREHIKNAEQLQKSGTNVDSLMQRMKKLLTKITERKLILERLVDSARDAGLISPESEEELSNNITRLMPKGSQFKKTGKI